MQRPLHEKQAPTQVKVMPWYAFRKGIFLEVEWISSQLQYLVPNEEKY